MKNSTNYYLTIEGLKGSNSKPFRKSFKTEAAYDRWMSENGDDVTVTRFISDSE